MEDGAGVIDTELLILLVDTFETTLSETISCLHYFKL